MSGLLISYRNLFKLDLFLFPFKNVQQSNDLEESSEPLNMSWPNEGRKRLTYVLVAPILIPLCRCIYTNFLANIFFSNVSQSTILHNRFFSPLQTCRVNTTWYSYTTRKELFRYNIYWFNPMDSRILVSYGLVGKCIWWNGRYTAWSKYEIKIEWKTIQLITCIEFWKL